MAGTGMRGVGGAVVFGEELVDVGKAVIDFGADLGKGAGWR